MVYKHAMQQNNLFYRSDLEITFNLHSIWVSKYVELIKSDNHLNVLYHMFADKSC